ncbi:MULTISPECIES: hypothetical protein [unclassified Microcoleus]|uniref:hypothetical protein n=1 Tax=unclassified Microcoleus TaxID=2642155 RepID=UPI002FD56743
MIIPTPAIDRARPNVAVHGCGATIIDRPPLLSITRHCYRAPAAVIDRSATPIEPTTY